MLQTTPKPLHAHTLKIHEWMAPQIAKEAEP